MSKLKTQSSSVAPLIVAPGRVLRGREILAEEGAAIARLGKRPLVVGGKQTLSLMQPRLEGVFQEHELVAVWGTYTPDSSQNSLDRLHRVAKEQEADVIIGVGGGKALDSAKLLGDRAGMSVVTIPTSAATCAAWSALSNIYSDEGAFEYDVALSRCPDLLILDYALVETAPSRTLVAGIGDAIAKWYESAVSSGNSSDTLTIAAVQQARILRDILFQKSEAALENPGSEIWQQVVDATVLLAGGVGGLGGANCRTVGAHAIHNGLTHLSAAHSILHGEKVAYGILVQLRLEELVGGNKLAATARQQLGQFYARIGLPQSLEELGLGNISLAELRRVAAVACAPSSDIHRLPFPVASEQVVAAMVSTTLAGEMVPAMAEPNS